MLSPPRCSARAGTSLRSPRSSANLTSGRLLATQRWTAPPFVWSPGPGLGRSNEPAFAARRGLPAVTPGSRPPAGRRRPSPAAFCCPFGSDRRHGYHRRERARLGATPRRQPDQFGVVASDDRRQRLRPPHVGHRPGDGDPAPRLGQLPPALAAPVHLFPRRHRGPHGRSAPAHPVAVPGGDVPDHDRPTGRHRHAGGRSHRAGPFRGGLGRGLAGGEGVQVQQVP